jgi:hypothetical protein
MRLTSLLHKNPCPFPLLPHNSDSRIYCYLHVVCENQQEIKCGKSEGIEFDALSKLDQSIGATKLVKSRLPY